MSDTSFKVEFEEKNESVDGESKWLWIKDDKGSWTGPKKDWEDSHKHKYFKNVKQFKCIITAGANQGMYVRQYAKLFSTVYAFEPDPINFYSMSVNNAYDNVIKIMGALGDTKGFIKVKRSSMVNTGMHTVEDGGAIPMFTIDSFEFETVDCIQLDTEGYEFTIIKGAVETIKRCKPVIIMENSSHPDLVYFMTELGYSIQEKSVSDTIWIPNN